MENRAGQIFDDPRKLSYQFVKKITNDFRHELGCGTFGRVFKGLLEDGSVVAVKVLHYFAPEINDQQFQNEFEILKKLKHPNIVRLVGFCDDTEDEIVEHKGKLVVCERIHRALCLEYVPNGNLGKLLLGEHLGNNWPIRYKIIKGICEGLKYLHEGLEDPIFHFDLKPDNILLDEKMVPKIADFGLSRLIGEGNTIKTMTPLGTVGYIPPEFINNQVISKEYDIFSLGVIIAQIITGITAYYDIADMGAQEFIDHVYENWKRSLQGVPKNASLEVDCKQVKCCIEIAMNCMEKERRKRPTIKDIVKKLDETGTVQIDLKLQMEKAVHNKESIGSLDRPYKGCFGLEESPEFLGNLLNLENLNLSHISFELPKALVNLRRLHTLDLTGCGFKKSFADIVNKMTDLKFVLTDDSRLAHSVSRHIIVSTENNKQSCMASHVVQSSDLERAGIMGETNAEEILETPETRKDTTERTNPQQETSIPLQMIAMENKDSSADVFGYSSENDECSAEGSLDTIIQMQPRRQGKEETSTEDLEDFNSRASSTLSSRISENQTQEHGQEISEYPTEQKSWNMADLKDRNPHAASNSLDNFVSVTSTSWFQDQNTISLPSHSQFPPSSLPGQIIDSVCTLPQCNNEVSGTLALRQLSITEESTVEYQPEDNLETENSVESLSNSWHTSANIPQPANTKDLVSNLEHESTDCQLVTNMKGSLISTEHPSFSCQEISYCNDMSADRQQVIGVNKEKSSDDVRTTEMPASGSSEQAVLTVDSNGATNDLIGDERPSLPAETRVNVEFAEQQPLIGYSNHEIENGGINNNAEHETGNLIKHHLGKIHTIQLLHFAILTGYLTYELGLNRILEVVVWGSPMVYYLFKLLVCYCYEVTS